MTSGALPQAILLDFDGTLVDSEPLHYRCWLEALRPWGGSTDWEDYQKRFVGITDRQAGRIFLTEAGYDARDELVRAACDTKHQIYRSVCAEELSISEENADVVRELSAQLLVGIVSSSITMELAPVLEKAGLNGSIRVLVTGEQVKRHKPDPEPYHLAVNLLKQIDKTVSASSCLVFEDSAAGLASATTAGMKVARVRHPSELPALIREHAAGLLDGSLRSA
jgi:beta-phosphoglucomutase